MSQDRRAARAGATARAATEPQPAVVEEGEEPGVEMQQWQNSVWAAMEHMEADGPEPPTSPPPAPPRAWVAAAPAGEVAAYEAAHAGLETPVHEAGEAATEEAAAEADARLPDCVAHAQLAAAEGEGA